MDKYAQLREALKSLVNTEEILLTTAEVVSVEGNTCTVKIDELEVPEVRLRATKISTDSQLLITPAKGTQVLIGSLSGDLRELVVLKVDVAEKIEVTTGESSYAMDSNGIVLNGGNNGGIIVLEKLAQEMMKHDNGIETLKLATSTALKALDALVPTSAAFDTATATIEKADLSQVANDKVKH